MVGAPFRVPPAGLALVAGGAGSRAASVCGRSADRREAGIWNNLGNQYASGLTGPIDYVEAAAKFLARLAEFLAPADVARARQMAEAWRPAKD